MASTFWGLYVGESGLSTFQAAINTTANNVANVQTEGYSKQQVKIEQAAALRTQTSYGTLGTGVSATSIEQLRDIYYDMKYWSNNSKLNEYSTKSYYLAQIEGYFEDSEDVAGFSTIFSNMYTALESLKTQSSEISARQTYVGTAQSLATYFSSTAESLKSLQEEINEVIGNKVESINTLAQKIASITKQINIIEQNGSNANDLRDERALLIDELSEIVPVTVEETVTNTDVNATTYQVKIADQLLVDTFDCNQLVCVARDDSNKVNQSDADGLYDIYWADSNGNPMNDKFNPFASNMTGSLKSLFELRDGNNAENFTGTVESYTYAADATNELNTTTSPASSYGELTVTSNVDVLSLSLNSTGTITIGGREVVYAGFEVETVYTTNADGESEIRGYSYTFYVDENDENNTSKVLSYVDGAEGKEAEVGESIDYMGIAYYMSQINQFARTYASLYNEIQLSGKDMQGNTAENFWSADDPLDSADYLYQLNYLTDDSGNELTDVDGNKIYDYSFSTFDNNKTDSSYYYLTASTLKVNEDVVNDPGKAVTSAYNATEAEASELVDELYALCTEQTVFRNTTADSFLQVVISDISVDTQAASIFETNYSNLSDSIEQQRMSVSGVDQDEEALDLVKYQNAYNLSSKVIQVLSEMYDKLITETGV
ncbi:MAG: flagellar hook-associated protein FlgK [Eubacterium sp.]|nr:flagellar hook-associated protein FlgK [Eubacterium sp.]